jgi:hypothetical protein
MFKEQELEGDDSRGRDDLCVFCVASLLANFRHWTLVSHWVPRVYAPPLGHQGLEIRVQ